MSDWPTPEAITIIDPSKFSPGSIVVLTVPSDAFTYEQANDLRRRFTERTGLDCLVLGGGVRLTVVEQP